MSTSPAAGALARPPRDYPTLDWLRAAAIVAVVFTHAGVGPYLSTLDWLLRSLWVPYHVPVFLFVSGVLYHAPEPIGVRALGPRFTRVLVPYLVASCAVWILGLAHVGGPLDALYRLAVGRALGIYYYVFLLLTCIPLVWVLSRVPRRWIVALLVVAMLAPFSTRPLIVTDASLRNPLNHAWAFFLAGWTARAFAPELARWRPRLEPALWSACVFGMGFYWLQRADWIDWPTFGLERAIYSLSVVGFVWLWVAGRPAPGAVRFLSRASFSIYLYHAFFVRPLRAPTLDWPVLPRVLLLVAVGLLGSCALVWAGRRLLGARSRLLLGS